MGFHKEVFMFRLLMLSIFLLASGCATIAVRFEGQRDKFPNVYPSTFSDVYEIHMICDYGWWYLGLPIVFDIPVSLVTDTVCLPYDAYKAIRR